MDVDLFLAAARVAASRTASITFWSDSDAPSDEVREPCLCTQDLDAPLDEVDRMLRSDDPDEVKEISARLKEHANGRCLYCKGEGVVVDRIRREVELNWSNANALAVLEVLGLEPDYSGSITVPEARRAVMRAKSRSSLSEFERPEEVLTRPREVEEGVTELHSPYLHSFSQSEDEIRRKIERFETLVREAEANGAKNILWG